MQECGLAGSPPPPESVTLPIGVLGFFAFGAWIG